MLRLQAAAGNRAVGALLADAQTKLAVGAADDGYEREADAIARVVVDRLIAAPREAAAPAELPDARRELVGRIRRRASMGAQGGQLDAATEASVRSNSGGQPLAAPVREQMEGAFGADFGKVRLHTGPDAADLNDRLGARAFTLGSNVFFRDGRPDLTGRPGLELLAHELTHTVQQGTAATVQRKVGFEFELGQVRTYKKGLMGIGTSSLPKKAPIIKGTGFKVEADEMEGYSDLEFVTDAFDETADGGDKLVKALQAIDVIVGVLAGTALNTEITAASIGQGSATANRFLQLTSKPLIGKPQATAGVRLDALDRLFEEVALAPAGAPGDPNPRTVFGGQMTPNTYTPMAGAASTGMADVQKARAATIQALLQVNNEAQSDPSNPVIGGPELRALVTQLTMYLVVGAQGSPGYAKLISGGFMTRTAFATTFQQLPQALVTYFTDFEDMFVRLVLIAAKQATAGPGYQGDMKGSGPIFEGGIYNDPGMYGATPKFQSEMPPLARQEWLVGIVKGTDKLTAAKYPGKQKDRDEIESLGSYGPNMDTLGYGQNAPLVEFRGLKEIYAPLFMPLALDLFRYVHTLNSGGREPFPGQVLALSQNDKLDLITGTPNAVAVRQKLIEEAREQIDWW